MVAKMGGKAIRTNVAGGMSGSPVYIDGKLVGAVALRLSVFSPDAICGITPIEEMLEIKDFDPRARGFAHARPKVAMRTPWARLPLPGDLLGQLVAAGAAGPACRESQIMVPIEAPLLFSGFTESTLREFGPLFADGHHAVQAAARAGISQAAKPAPGWEHSLNPGDPWPACWWMAI
jgi:hypothetical protein